MTELLIDSTALGSMMALVGSISIALLVSMVEFNPVEVARGVTDAEFFCAKDSLKRGPIEAAEFEG